MSLHETAPRSMVPQCRFQAACQLSRSMPEGVGCRFAQRMTVAKLDRREFLYHEDDPVRGLFILLTGIVALERVSERGDRVIVRLVRPGEPFPYIDLTVTERHTSAARALTPATACFISRERLMEATFRAPRFGLAMISLGSSMMRRSEEALLRLCTSEFPDLVLSELRMLGTAMGQPTPDGGVEFTLPMNWQDFAAMIGITPESLSRLLRRLAKTGRLSFQGRRITVSASDCGAPPWSEDRTGRTERPLAS